MFAVYGQTLFYLRFMDTFCYLLLNKNAINIFWNTMFNGSFRCYILRWYFAILFLIKMPELELGVGFGCCFWRILKIHFKIHFKIRGLGKRSILKYILKCLVLAFKKIFFKDLLAPCHLGLFLIFIFCLLFVDKCYLKVWSHFMEVFLLFVLNKMSGLVLGVLLLAFTFSIAFWYVWFWHSKKLFSETSRLLVAQSYFF